MSTKLPGSSSSSEPTVPDIHRSDIHKHDGRPPLPIPPPSSPAVPFPTFKAINDPIKPTLQHCRNGCPTVSENDPHSLPATLTPATSPQELQDRDFMVDKITAWKEGVTEVEYLTTWPESHITPDMLFEEKGSRCVRCAGKDWKVREVFDWTTEAEPGKLHMTAAWEPTWQALSSLTDAAKAIDDFETEQSVYANADLDGVHRTYTSGQLLVEWPTAPKFSPKANVDYAPAVLRMVSLASSPVGKGKGGELRPFVQRCMSRGIKRALRIRAGLVTTSKGRRLLDLERGEKLDSALIYIFGIVKPRSCDGCAKSLGVYTCCVTMPDYAYGACANCVHDGRRRSCNYHSDPHPGVLRYNADGHDVHGGGIDNFEGEGVQQDGHAARSIEAEDPEYFDPDAGADDVVDDANDPDYTEPGMAQSPLQPDSPSLRRSRSSRAAVLDNTATRPSHVEDVQSQQATLSLEPGQPTSPHAQLSASPQALQRLPSPAMNKRVGEAALQQSIAKRRRSSHGEGATLDYDAASASGQQPVRHTSTSPASRQAATSQFVPPSQGAGAGSSAQTRPSPSPPAVQVFRNHRFQLGEATPGHVKYVLSVADPKNRRRLDLHWRNWLGACEKSGMHQGYASHLEFLSDCGEDVLNDIVSQCCPAPPVPVGAAAGTHDDAILID